MSKLVIKRRKKRGKKIPKFLCCIHIERLPPWRAPAVLQSIWQPTAESHRSVVTLIVTDVAAVFRSIFLLVATRGWIWFNIKARQIFFFLHRGASPCTQTHARTNVGQTWCMITGNHFFCVFETDIFSWFFHSRRTAMPRPMGMPLQLQRRPTKPKCRPTAALPQRRRQRRKARK